MNKDNILENIFQNDPFGLLEVKPKNSNARTSNERLTTSFEEINNFIEKNKREPQPDPTNISEYKLYSTLKGLRENPEKMMVLEPQDRYGLLKNEEKEINSLDDILGDDSQDILAGDAEGLFTFNHTPKDDKRAKADFIGKRFKCKDFDKYEHLFKEVQDDLALGKRKLVHFKEPNLRAGNYYVHNGVLFLLESVNYDRQDSYMEDGTRIRRDGRTRCVFENGTESNIMLRSVVKYLYRNGKVVTQNVDDVIQEFTEVFSEIRADDKESGTIYVLKSKTQKEELLSIKNLYKIGYTKTSVEQRIRNAQNEPTYLMAPVIIESSWKCFNMNAQKFEQLIQRFFGEVCLDIDITDNDGITHTPREWFIVPIEAIEQAISLIIDGKIIDYTYDVSREMIVPK